MPDRKILYTAFSGRNNSSKILLDRIRAEEDDKLYLRNSFQTCVEQFKKKLQEKDYELVVSFGQAPLNANTVKIETRGTINGYYETEYDYASLKERLREGDFQVVISEDAGNYLCNHIYFYGMKYIAETKLQCKMIFIHVPGINNIGDVEALAGVFSQLD